MVLYGVGPGLQYPRKGGPTNRLHGPPGPAERRGAAWYGVEAAARRARLGAISADQTSGVPDVG